MSDDKNITKNEMRFFQNDLLTDLKKLELQINSKISNINQTVLTKTNEYDSKFNKIFENITELISQVAARKFDNERVEELLGLKVKFREQIIENKTRISMVEQNLQNSIFKYDQMILDNLQIPGLLGVGCKYKNGKMLFEYLYNEMNLYKKNKDQEQTMLKEFQSKIDSKIFKLEDELSKIHQNINQICQTKFEKFFIKLEQRLQTTEGILHSSRIENSKYAEDLIKASTSLQIQWERLENIKNEIYDKFYEELDTFKKLVDYTNRNYFNQDKEFKIFKERFTQLADYLKDFRNLNNKYKEITRNINFSKNQKLNKDFDVENYNKIGNDIKGYIQSPSPLKNRGKLTLNENDKTASRRESFSSLSSKKLENQRLWSPQKQRRNSMFVKDKQINIDNKKIEKSKIPEKRTTNYNITKAFNSNMTKNNNIKKVQTMTIKKNDNKKSKLLNEIGLKTEQKKQDGQKKFLKIIKKQKKIVTENNIDLNFGTKKKVFENIKENESSKEEENEEDELISVESKSSNFSFSSMMISLHNMEQQEEIKDIKKVEKSKEKTSTKNVINNKEKEKEKIISPQKINSKDKYNINIKDKDIKEKIYNKDNNIKDKVIKEIINKKDNYNNKESESKEKINNNINNINLKENIIKEKINDKLNFSVTEKINNKKNIERVESINKYKSKEKNENREKNNEKINSDEKNIEKTIKKESEIPKTNENEKIINESLINNIDKIGGKEGVSIREKINTKEITNKKEIKEEPEISKKILNLKEKIIDNKFYKTLNNFPKLNMSTKDKTIDRNNDVKNNINININSNNSSNKNRTITKSNDIPNETKEREFKPITNIQNSLINSNKEIKETKENNFEIIKNIQNTQINLHKSNKFMNNSIDKIKQLNDTPKEFSLEERVGEKNNKIKFINDDMSLSKIKQKIKKFDSVTIIDNKKKLELIEYNNSNTNNIKINTEISFPQIKTCSNELTTKDNYKITENTPQQQSSNGYMNTSQNEFRKTISQHFKRNQFNFNNLKDNAKKNNSKEDKQKITNTINSNDEKEIIKSNNVFNIIENAKKKFKKLNSNNNENINNAFLTSLNNINNNYNYFYNNNNLSDNNNIINILNKKNQSSDKKIDKFTNKIEFINVNIKSVNHRINILEDRYQVILKQLNNIYKIVVSSYHHKKKVRRSTIKEKTIIQKKEDLSENKKFMNKISELYNDNEYNLKKPNEEYNNTLKRIEPFLIKKFKSNK